MKLSAKLTWMLVSLVSGIVVMGMFSLYQMDRINEKATEISANWLPSSVYIQNINTLASDFRTYEVNHIFSEDLELFREYEQKMDTIKRSIDTLLPKYHSLIVNDREQAIYDAFMRDWTAYLALNTKLVQMSRDMRTHEAVTLMRTESRTLFDRMSANLMQAVQFNVQGGELSSAEGDALFVSARVLVIFILVGLTVLAVILGVLIVRSTLRTLGADPGELMSVARRVTSGDYNIDNGQPRQGVYADIVSMVDALKDNINRAKEESNRARVESDRAREAMVEAEKASQKAQEKTRTILNVAGRLEDVVNIVSSASTELSAQIEQSERGASVQAARITETATAMDEMNSTVIEVARNAGAASDVSASTRSKAESGADVVRKAVASIQAVQQQTERLKEDMVKLDENAKAISQIMGVISDIADQTNLLALNAAIEAARAGEAGRGFAVVADEVRKLAEKTMASTTDVGNAIRGIQDSVNQSMEQMDMSVRQVEEATSFASQSGSALAEIVSMVDSTADQVRAIATASEQQSASSDEISRSISQVNVIASETAQAMGEASRAVSDLAQQSQVLTQLIAEMKKG